MAFPVDPLGVLVELQLGGTWTDITTKTYVRDSIKIKRGRSSEGRDVDPTRCNLTLDNRDGRFSPRNPAGPYYGLIGRNTPLRVSVLGIDEVSLQIPVTSSATTPSVAALNTAQDLDVRVELLPYAWWKSGGGNLYGKWDFASQCSWVLTTGDGYLTLFWTTTGLSAGFIGATCTVRLPRDSSRRFAVRALLDVDNGAGGRTVTFYYADSTAGPWLQLGDPVVQAGVTSVFASTTPLTIAPGGSMLGQYYRAELRTGALGATLASSVDFTLATAGAGTHVDTQGRTWTLTGSAVLSTASVRFVGEVSAWPARWDPSGQDVYVPIEAAGIMRRLLANAPPLRSVLRRSTPALTALRAYWPMEDASGATSLAYGLSDPLGANYMTMAAGASPASYSGFAASDPLPTFGSGGYARGRVPSYTATSQLQARWVGFVPSSGPPADGTVLLKLTTTTAIFSVLYRTAGGLSLTAVDASTGVALFTGGAVGFSLLDKPLRFSLELTQSGANTSWTIGTLAPDASVGSVTGGTVAGAVPGRANYVQVGAPGTNSAVAAGHVTVESAVTSLFDLGVQLGGYKSEAAATRASRLATEEGYALATQGSSGTPLGPQKSLALIDLLRQTEDSDLGFLYEVRGTASLAFRTRASMWGRGPALTLDYTQQHLSSFEPTEDDALAVNDVLLTREGGSSYEALLAAGAMSTAAPPAGIGRYQAALTLSLGGDTQLRDQANYRLGLGTLDEPRYPSLGVELHRSPFTATPALARAALALDVGDIVQVLNPPAFYSPASTLQRIEGYLETLHPKLYRLDYVCSPGQVWANVGTYSDPTGQDRYDSGASTLAAGVTSSATTLSVAITDGLWTTTPAHWPFQIMVAGEIMTVTAIAGAASPQTFTVTRSVNGVSKAQLAGAAVHVYPVSYYGF